MAEPKPGVRIMTDPGAFSNMQNEETGITVVFITHEHSDHLHVDSLKQVLAHNPTAQIVTNSAVGAILNKEGISHTLLEEGGKMNLHGVEVTAFGDLHAEIYNEFGRVQNTGYTFDSLCYLGDAFHYPSTAVDILALPVCGPWMKTKDAIEYYKNIRPRIAFPVHDGMLVDSFPVFWKVPETFMKEDGIIFKKLEIGQEEDL